MAPRSILGLAILVAGLSGCSCIATKQDWHYRIANQHRASKAWKCCYSAERRKSLGADFKNGFKAGYVERSIGKECRAPAVPPPKYWTAKYQCCEGQQAIQDWFRGFQCGVAAAESNGHPYFNDIPVSASAPRTNVTACGKCQSCEPCGCQESQWKLTGFSSQVPPPVTLDATATIPVNAQPTTDEPADAMGEMAVPSVPPIPSGKDWTPMDQSPVPPPPPAREGDTAFLSGSTGSIELPEISSVNAARGPSSRRQYTTPADSAVKRFPAIETSTEAKTRPETDTQEVADTLKTDGTQHIGLIGGFGAADVVLFGPMDAIFCSDSAVRSASGSK